MLRQPWSHQTRVNNLPHTFNFYPRKRTRPPSLRPRDERRDNNVKINDVIFPPFLSSVAFPIVCQSTGAAIAQQRRRRGGRAQLITRNFSGDNQERRDGNNGSTSKRMTDDRFHRTLLRLSQAAFSFCVCPLLHRVPGLTTKGSPLFMSQSISR